MLARTLTLTPAGRAALERGRDRDPRPYFRERCAALLNVADGASPRWVARRGLHRPRQPKTVCAGSTPTRRAAWPGWCSRRGDTAVFPPQQGEALVAMVRQAPTTHGLDRSRWRLVDLPGVLPFLAGYSLGGSSRALRRLGVSRQRGRLAVHSPDPAYGPK